MNKSFQVIRPVELAKRLSVSTVTIWRMEQRGELPPRRKISTRVVGWLASDLEEWAKNRPYVDESLKSTEAEK